MIASMIIAEGEALVPTSESCTRFDSTPTIFS